jgi:hypothetical protein
MLAHPGGPPRLARPGPARRRRRRSATRPPLPAVEDVGRRFSPDHILIALRVDDHDAWQERHLVDDVRGAFHIRINVFELDRTGRVPPPEAA